jgi:hypothetical protein
VHHISGKPCRSMSAAVMKSGHSKSSNAAPTPKSSKIQPTIAGSVRMMASGT